MMAKMIRCFCGSWCFGSINNFTNPFRWSFAEVRIGRVNGEFICNPTQQQVNESDIELIVAGTADSIMMVEGESNEISEDDLLNALKLAHYEIKKIIQLQIELREAAGKAKWEIKATDN